MKKIKEFDWDSANRDKNWLKHKVSWSEFEEVFFNRPLLLQNDAKHSNVEKRYYVLGRTNQERRLFIAFTLRDQRIRVISARNMSQNERQSYEKETAQI